MIEIDSMMVCMDLSEVDEKLVVFTRSICERLPVKKVFFVHNIKTAELSEDFKETFGDVELDKEIENSLADLVAEHFNNACDYEILVSEEPNTEVILAHVVKQYKVKLTLLGKRMSDKSTNALGTKLLRILPCSILVFPETASLNIDRVLVPIDFTDSSVHALRLSKSLVDQLGIDLEIMHVFKLTSQFFPFVSEAKAIKEAEEEVKQKFANLQKKQKEIAGVPYILVRAAGKSKAERINMQLSKGKHNLLVLGLKGKDQLPSLSLGSVPTELYNMDINVPLWLVYSEEVIK